MRKTTVLVMSLVLSMTMLSPQIAHSQNVTYTKVTDVVRAPPVLRGDSLAFVSNSGLTTIINGTTNVVASSGTPIPGGSGSIGSIVDRIGFDGTNVAFVGANAGTAVYTDQGGTLRTVANNNTVVPGQTETFIAFNPGTIDNGRISFLGQRFEGAVRTNGVYLDDNGVLSVVADDTVPVPGGTGNFSRVGNPSISGDSVAFVGGGPGRSGVAIIGPTSGFAADTNTPIPGPGGTGNFTGFTGAAPVLDGDDVAFFGVRCCTGFVQVGFYARVGGNLIVVADNTTTIPGTTDLFSFQNNSQDEVGIDEGNVAFLHQESGTPDGLYMLVNGNNLIKVVDTNDLLDGQRPLGFSFRDGLSGNKLAFVAFFRSRRSIYVAEVTFDSDGDGIPDDQDNCPLPNIGDSNGDGFDDACVDPTVQLPPDLDIGANPIIGANADFGSGVTIGDNFEAGNNVDIGKDVDIGNGTSVGDDSKIHNGSTLGDMVEVGEDVTIFFGVIIGDRVTIGVGATIKAGAVIGNDAVIGAGAVIGRNATISDGAIVPPGAKIKNGATFP